MAETLASFVPATAVPRSTVHREVVLGRVGWCGWWEMMSTLLDPEGTTMTAREGRVVVSVLPGMAWSSIPPEGAGDGARVWWGALGCGLVVG